MLQVDPDSAETLSMAQKTRWFPGTLRAAVLSMVVIGLLVPTLVLFFLEYRISTSTAEQTFEKDLDRATSVLALAMQGQLWDLSQANAELIVRATMDDRFVSVLVYDSTNTRPFVEVHNDRAAQAAVQSRERTVEQHGMYIGRVVVTMTKDPYLAANRIALRWLMLRTAVMLFVAIGLIIFVLQERLLHPIAVLTNAAARFGQGNLGVPIEASHSDELGQVALAMENMRKALLRAFADLQGKNQELTDHANLLEARVAERTEALTMANHELRKTLDTLKSTQAGLIESEKLASLGRLVAGVAHELNTPLGNALTVVSTLEDHFNELSQALANNSLRRSELITVVDATREGQEILRRNIDKASDLIHDFKQLAIDQTTDMRRKFALDQVVREVLITILPSFKPTPYRVETSLAVGINMDSYPGPLGQVLTNILLNALIHAFDGLPEGRVLIEAALADDPDHVKVICADNGHGMSAEIAHRIFDPFFTTKLGKGGSGLGLHVSYSIVTGLLGGSIEVNSAVGQGTRFILTLPLNAPHRADSASA